MDFKDIFLANVRNSNLCAGNRNIQTRCIFCNELGNYKPSSRHLWIRIPTESDIGIYHCFKCEESGIVNGKFLRKFDIYDANLISNIEEINRKISTRRGVKVGNNTFVKKLNYRVNRGNKNNEIKLGYINDRLGLDLDYMDIERLKIVLSIKDFLKYNNINEYSRDNRIVDQIDKYYCGFGSLDNSLLNMRFIGNDDSVLYKSLRGRRYQKYNIFNEIDNSKRYYIIPTDINTMINIPVQLHIAEGPFDILSVYYNLDINHDNSIFAAIGGKGYINLLKYFISNLGIINFDLYLYADSDVDNYLISNISDLVRVFDNNMYVIKNIYPGEKDMGVPKDRIKTSIAQVVKRIF